MKAQITLFILLGVIVILVVAGALYFSGRVRDSSLLERRSRLSVQPVRDYVDSCLLLVSNEAFRNAGRQGGHVFVSQGGLTPVPVDFLSYDGVHVPFGVVPPEGSVAGFVSDPPLYPFDGFPYSPVTGGLSFDGFYGLNRLPWLYKFVEDRFVPGSIQESLEAAVAENVVKCADWSGFEGYEFSVGSPNVSLTFSDPLVERFVSVELSWPVDVVLPSGERASFENFAVKVPVRLAGTYLFVRQIVDADVTNVSFDPSVFDNVGVVRVGDDSLMVVGDPLSRVGNSPFEFWVARKNRAPALWAIDTSDLREVFHVMPDGRGASISVDGGKLVVRDPPCPDFSEASVDLNASDPDEDDVVFVVDKSEVRLPPPGAPQLFKFRVSAVDAGGLRDYQDITLRVALCEIR